MVDWMTQKVSSSDADVMDEAEITSSDVFSELLPFCYYFDLIGQAKYLANADSRAFKSTSFRFEVLKNVFECQVMRKETIWFPNQWK